MEYQRDLKQMIEQYNEELLRAYQKHNASDDTEDMPDAQEADTPVGAVPAGEPSFTEDVPDAQEAGAAATEETAERDAEDTDLFLMEDLEDMEEYGDLADILQMDGIPDAEDVISFDGYDSETAPVVSDPAEPPAIGYIQAWVSDNDNHPVSGAVVTVSSRTEDGAYIHYQALSNIDGLSPMFPLLADETYHLTAEAGGYYRMSEQPFTAVAGQSEVVAVRLSAGASR